MTAINISERPLTRPFNPTPEQAAKLASARKSCDWFWQLPPTELGKYTTQCAAVYECEVIAVAATLGELLPKVAAFDRGKIYFAVALRSRIQARRA